MKKSKWSRREILGAVASLFLGAVLILAALGKAVEPLVFAQQIRNEGLDFWFSANTVMLLALALEMGLGLALLLLIRSRWIILTTAGLIGLFIFLNGRNYWLILQGVRDASYECGCFGVLFERSGPEAFWQDLLILVPPLALILWARRLTPHLPPARSAIAVSGALLLVSYTVFVQGLPPAHEEASSLATQSQGGFGVASSYQVLVNGEVAQQATVYESQQVPQMVIHLPKQNAWLLLDVRLGKVQELASDSIKVFQDDSLAISEEGELRELGEFSLNPEGLVFSLGSATVQLRNR